MAKQPATPDSQAAEPQESNDLAAAGKGHATPTRAEREAARKRPLVPGDRKAAAKDARSQNSTARDRARAGMAAGDDRYLTARDKGPQRRYVRDYVDARFNIGEFMIPVMLVVIILTFLPLQALQFYGIIVLWVFFVIAIIDCFLLAFRVQRKIADKFGASRVERGLRWYSAMRALQLRVIRLPKPQVKRGQFPELASMTITAAADGSALGNPGPAGWAWYVDESTWAAGGWPHGTNNQGELMAVIDLLESTAAEDDDLVILCDSQYVINAVTKWMPGWKRKGWRKADGSPVQNLELLKRLDDALSDRDYTFEWVRGHNGHELNEAADVRARAAATAYQNKTSIPSGPGWSGAQGETDRAAPTRTTNPSADADGISGARTHGSGATAALFDLEDEDVSDEEVVIALERRLLDPFAHTDIGDIAGSLHPDFVEIGLSGRLWDRDTAVQQLSTDADNGAVDEIVSVSRLSADSELLLVYRSRASGADVLRSSLWLYVDGRWRLRFRQATAA